MTPVIEHLDPFEEAIGEAMRACIERDRQMMPSPWNMTFGEWKDKHRAIIDRAMAEQAEREEDALRGAAMAASITVYRNAQREKRAAEMGAQ